MRPAIITTLVGVVSLVWGVMLFSVRAGMIVFGVVAIVLGLLVETSDDEDVPVIRLTDRDQL